MEEKLKLYHDLARDLAHSYGINIALFQFIVKSYVKDEEQRNNILDELSKTEKFISNCIKKINDLDKNLNKEKNILDEI